MITDETALLAGNTQARIAGILELELRYLQDELNTISTQAALIGTAGFAALCVPQKDGFIGGSLDDPDFDSNLQNSVIAIYIGFASATCSLSALTVCSALFLNLWGANDALRTKTIESLTLAIASIRSERILTLRIFTIAVVVSVRFAAFVAECCMCC